MIFSDLIHQALYQALVLAWQEGALGSLAEAPRPEQVIIEKPKNPDHGDYATPVALSLTKLAKIPPRALAEALRQRVQDPRLTLEIAGPGFINIRVGDALVAQGLADLLAQGPDFGRTRPVKPERILLEFVSANPTGPLHMGHGRWAALGSTLANLLKFAGYDVTREFYINDAGNQMEELGRSLKTRYLSKLGFMVVDQADLALFIAQTGSLNNPYIESEQVKLGYRGIAIRELADEMEAKFPLEALESGEVPFADANEMISWCTNFAYQRILEKQKKTLKDFNTEFDHWFSEQQLHVGEDDSAIAQGIKILTERGHLYQGTGLAPSAETGEDAKGNATFFRTTNFGDDKDRVVIRSDGRYTYMAADIAYHKNKLDRGYDRLINLLGADHHGYVPRLQAIVQGFGYGPDTLEVIIGQLVKLYRTNGTTGEKEEVRMSKRTGEGITVDNLLYGIDSTEDAIGVDAARWYLLSQSSNSQILFDLDLAVKQSLDNPVYYVQYVHARTCSLERVAQREGIPVPERISFDTDTLPFTEPEERALAMLLLTAPEEFRLAAQERAPQRITRYAETVAQVFNRFYDRCRVLSVIRDQPTLAYARWGLFRATRVVIANSLHLLGISAPEVM